MNLLLEKSRRVDWRFLLPDPDLGKALIIGKPDRGLVEALATFALSLECIEGGPQPHELLKGSDLVVTCDARPTTLARIPDLLRENGWLYLESSSRSAYQAENYLQRLGFTDIQLHWHWPNFNSCQEIVPLDQRAAIIHALARRHGSRQAILKSQLGRLAVRAGLFRFVVTDVSVIARMPAGGER